MPRIQILALLDGDDRRTIGRSNHVATIVSQRPKLFPELIKGMWSTNPLVRMRSADAIEKVTRKHRQLLQPFKKRLLRLMSTTEQQELRWHLAVMVPRLLLTARERQVAVSSFESYLEDHSSIVKTFALQGLADLAQNHPTIRSQVREILHAANRTGTPAMKARSRRLLLQLAS
jgi:hypothetical protein